MLLFHEKTSFAEASASSTASAQAMLFLAFKSKKEQECPLSVHMLFIADWTIRE
jgi:hypothetical protein